MGNQARRRSERLRRERQRQRLIAGAVVAGVIAIIVIVIAVASRSGGVASGPTLSDEAARGKELAVTYSCTGCHGRNGEGNTGPAWQGLYGSTVALTGGGTVVADRPYLVESILQPGAKHVDGWGVMPEEAVPEADLEAIVQYIVELATPASTSS